MNEKMNEKKPVWALIIDPNLQHRQAIATLLVHCLSHVRIAVYDPDRDPPLGLKFQWKKFDLVVMDIGSRAKQAKKWYQKLSKVRTLPAFIFLQIDCQVDHAIDFMDLGALDYICKKKLSPKRLLKPLKKLPGQQAIQATPVIPIPTASPVSPDPSNEQLEKTDELEATLHVLDTNSAMAKAVGAAYEAPAELEHTQRLPDINILKARFDEKIAHISERLDSPSPTPVSQPKNIVQATFTDEDIQNGTASMEGYKIIEEIGTGATATVYKISRKSDNQILALKLCSPDIAQDQDTRDRFIQEFELIKSIKHTHIVTVYEQGFYNDSAYIIMEFFPSLDLKHRIQSGLKLAQVISFTAQITVALQAAHKHGIIHRDLKPVNILFREDGSLALADFGIAKLMGSHNRVKTATGTMVGTPSYVSPEQITGKKLDGRCDLYTLGVILYEMLENRKPFLGASAIDVMYAHLKSAVPSFNQNWGVMGDITMTLLEKNPDQRFQNASDLLDALYRAYPKYVNSSLLKVS